MGRLSCGSVIPGVFESTARTVTGDQQLITALRVGKNKYSVDIDTSKDVKLGIVSGYLK
jgi:hypothetical protein